MLIPITIPELGIGDEAVRISGWLVEPGEAVEPGDRLVELLVAGITFDLPATASGSLQTVIKPVDSLVSIGEIVGWISETEETETEDVEIES